MKRFAAVFFLLILTVATPAAAQNYDIIVAFGQSNCTQVGYGTYFDPLQSPAIDGRIKTLTRFGSELFKVIPALNSDGSEHLENWNNYSAASKKHAFIISFARRYVKNRLAVGREVLILPAARGATSVLEWNRKLIVYPESPLLYNDMAGKLNYLLSIKGNRIVSFNMALGESDVVYSDLDKHGMTPRRFADEMLLLLKRIKSEFPGVPIITTKFPPQWMPGSALKAQIETKLQNVTTAVGGMTVETGGLISNTGPAGSGAEVHYNAQSMQKLGERHWNAFNR